jgi:hypothetical protein
VIIDQIDINGVHAVKGKDQSPIPRNRYRSITLEVALERMMLPAGQVHALRACAGAKSQQEQAPPRDVLGVHAPRVAVFKQAAQPLVPKTPYHVSPVT